MQNIEKRKTQYFKNFLYNRVKFVPSIQPLYALIVILNMICSSVVSFEYIMSENHDYINVKAELFFYIQIGLLSLFFIITAGSVFSIFLKHVWMYYLMLLESLTIFFVRSIGICFSTPTATFYEGSITMKLGQTVIFVTFCLIIVVFRNNAYYPFQDVSHLFSMRQNNSILTLLGFRTSLGFIIYHDIFSSKSDQLRGLIIITFIIFWKSRDTGYLHQLSRKIWDIYYYFISWTCFTFFIANFINLINDKINMRTTNQPLTFRESALYFWLYTFPFVITLPLLKSATVSDDFWKNIFKVGDHQLEKVYRKQLIYILCDQLHKIVESLKKSQLKYKDPDFKKLWAIIKEHNSNCTLPTCPLHQLEDHKDESNDDFHEHRKFLKTLKNCLQFSRMSLQKLKQKHPDDIEMEIQIAHFYLVALKNKQKGMVLYNSYVSKKVKPKDPSKQSQFDSQKSAEEEMEISKKSKSASQQSKKSQNLYTLDHMYAIYFLKKEIDNIFIGEQKQANVNADNELSEFRQKIEVSVTMLAQFWSLLADPKCNLKKMYDLTNFLFPLKLSLEQDWERIKLLKNIEIYSVYAKYLIRMFNDKENGLKILDEANKIDHEQKNKQEIELDEKGGELIEESGMIFMEYDGKNSGVMYQVNINAQKIFGYNKGQLLNKKVNDIMPEIYAEQHDRVLENYQQTNYSTMMNKQRHVWGKSKEGFLVPFTILIKPILSFYSQASSSEVYANIKRENYLKEIIGIIIDKNEMVHEYSTSALRLFPLLLEKYESKTKGPGYKFKNEQEKKIIPKLNITELIPNFREVKQKLLVENQEYDIKIQRMIKTSKTGEESFVEKCSYSVSITEINLRTCGKVGYLIKLIKLGNSDYQSLQKPVLGESSPNPRGPALDNKDDLLELNNTEEKENLRKKQPHEDVRDRAKKQKQSKVKFEVSQQPDPGLGRKFIFSYDMANKHKTFSSSVKKIDPTGNANTLCRSKVHKKQSSNATEEKQVEEMKYVGGYTRSRCMLDKIKNDTVSSFRAQLKVSEQKNEQAKIDYGKGIKPKRLIDNVVKQLREEDAEMEFNNAQGDVQKQEHSHQMFSEIKPSELSLILSKESKNKYIVNLRIITAVLLILCSVLSIVEYNILGDTQTSIQAELLKIKKLSEIKTEMLSINMYVNYLTEFSSQEPLTFHELHANIDELNEMLNNFVFNQNSQLVYSDGSSDNYYLGFALNKLISQANSVVLNDNGRIVNDPSTYFVQYNTVNGMSVSLDQEAEDVWQDLLTLRVRVLTLCIIFVGAGLFICSVIILIKNILLRLVIHKKTEILEIFFQIPRVACSIIQKQCETFIVQLSVENQEDEMEIENSDEELESQHNKNAKIQKKRTTVGEENTQFMYCIVSILFLLMLVSYQLFILAKCNIQQQDLQKLTTSTRLFYKIEYRLFEMATYMESIKVNSSLPIYNTPSKQAILANLYSSFAEEILQVRINFYELQQILDDDFDQKAIKIYYQSTCDQPDTCTSWAKVEQENNGLNSIIAKYLEVLKSNYRYLETEPNPTPDQSNFLKVKEYQLSMKENWRRLTKVIQESEKKYLDNDQSVNLWVLVVVCVLYLVLLMMAWMKYYWRLEERIVATQYILAFIPIDEINKNKKIANYIRNEISNRK